MEFVLDRPNPRGKKNITPPRTFARPITAELGLQPCGEQFERVPQTAGGSSFDGVEFRQNASKMKVFDRWRQFLDDADYLAIFDRDMIELAKEIFGPSPAADAIGKRILLCEKARRAEKR